MYYLEKIYPIKDDDGDLILKIYRTGYCSLFLFTITNNSSYTFEDIELDTYNEKTAIIVREFAFKN
jgi:hypothetical protein